VWEPIQDLIQSFGSLYLEPEQDDEVEDSTELPPPTPPEEEDESLISMVLANRVKKLENTMSEVKEKQHPFW